MMTFTFEQKLAAVKRELAFRRRVYARRIGEGKMTQTLADEQIGVMEAIAADYEKAIATQSPELF
jgi:hypothetical protein